MSYIGKIPTIGNFVKLDAITTSSTNTYNLTLDSVAFSPESPNHCLVSLNGVIQAPTTSFSISGSTITFIPSSGTLASSDSIDFIMVYGNVLDLGVPSDATVTNAKTNFVSTSSAAGLQIKGDGTTDGTLQLNCSQNSHGIKLKSPAHSASASYTLTFPTTDGNADEFLKTDGSGVLSWASAGGNPTHISRTTNSSDVTTISVQSCFSASYDVYKIIFYLSTTQANGDVYMRFLKNTSDNFTGTDLNGNLIGARGTTTGTAFNNGGVSSSTSIKVAHHDIYSGASSGLLGEFTIANAFNRSDGRMHIKFQGVGDGASGIENFDGAWVYSGSEIATGFQFYSGSGSTRFNFSEINVYGYNQ